MHCCGTVYRMHYTVVDSQLSISSTHYYYILCDVINMIWMCSDNRLKLPVFNSESTTEDNPPKRECGAGVFDWV